MAKLKSEVLQKKHDAGSTSVREKLIKYSRRMAESLAGHPFTPIVNYVQRGWLARQFLSVTAGIHQSRTLPPFASVTLGQWYRENYKADERQPKVALFADTYIQYHEPKIGIAAIELLSSCGYYVLLAEAGCCQRPKISNGFLKDARSAGTDTAINLHHYIKMGVPVLVCEPSCTSALTDDLPDLLEDETLATSLENGIFQIEEFLAREIRTKRLRGSFMARDKEVIIHGHCHLKSSKGMNALETILATYPGNKFSIAQSGCCGMAGSFGYEKEHYHISKKIYQQSLGAQLDQDKTVSVWAPGFSCRHQIRDFGNTEPCHWVESVSYSD
jgi:Fe-S oxidoreductase